MHCIRWPWCPGGADRSSPSLVVTLRALVVQRPILSEHWWSFWWLPAGPGVLVVQRLMWAYLSERWPWCPLRSSQLRAAAPGGPGDVLVVQTDPLNSEPGGHSGGAAGPGVLVVQTDPLRAWWSASRTSPSAGVLVISC